MFSESQLLTDQCLQLLLILPLILPLHLLLILEGYILLPLTDMHYLTISPNNQMTKSNFYSMLFI